MSKKVTHLEELFLREVADLVRDEDLMVQAMTLFEKAASNQVLAEVFSRLKVESEKLARSVEKLVSAKTQESRRDAVRGILEEGQRRAKEIENHHLVDVELISTAQRLLGYLMASYRSVLPLARLLKNTDLILVCETAIDCREKAIQLLTETALHQVHWRASWWIPEHNTAWQKVKTLFKEDWQRTKEHLGVSEAGEVAPEERDFEKDEPAFRYGYGASLYYSDREWDESTADMLRSEYGGVWDDQTRVRVARGWAFARISQPTA